MTCPSDLTLGEVRNRIDALIQRNLFSPGLSAGIVFSTETFRDYLSNDPKNKQRVHSVDNTDR